MKILKIDRLQNNVDAWFVDTKIAIKVIFY